MASLIRHCGDSCVRCAPASPLVHNKCHVKCNEAQQIHPPCSTSAAAGGLHWTRSNCKHSRPNCSRLQFHGAPLAHSGASSFRSVCVFARRRSIRRLLGRAVMGDFRRWRGQKPLRVGLPGAWAGRGPPDSTPTPMGPEAAGASFESLAPSRQCRRGPPGHATAAAPALSDPAPSAANVGHCTWLRTRDTGAPAVDGTRNPS